MAVLQMKVRGTQAVKLAYCQGLQSVPVEEIIRYKVLVFSGCRISVQRSSSVLLWEAGSVAQRSAPVSSGMPGLEIKFSMQWTAGPPVLKIWWSGFDSGGPMKF